MKKIRIPYPKLRELAEAVKALIKGPYTSKFPYQPHKPAEGFRGKPQFFEKDCVGCAVCAQVCPASAISVTDELNIRILKIRLDLCIFCGQCQANCLTEKGIKLTQEFDLATLQNRGALYQAIEKELVLCEGCNEVIAPKEQMIWVAEKLGALVFANTSLLSYFFGEKDLAEIKSSLVSQMPSSRSDRFKLFCPKCRRQAVLKS